jgi:hypothetical protein
MFEALDFTFTDLAASIILVGVMHRSRARAAGHWGFGRVGTHQALYRSDSEPPPPPRPKSAPPADEAAAAAPAGLSPGASMDLAGAGASACGSARGSAGGADDGGGRRRRGSGWLGEAAERGPSRLAGARHTGGGAGVSCSGSACSAATGNGGGGRGGVGEQTGGVGAWDEDGEGDALLEVLKDAEYWHRYATAIYGWPMFLWFRKYRWVYEGVVGSATCVGVSVCVDLVYWFRV